MKRYLLLLVLPMLLLATSCTKTTQNVVVPNQTVYANIGSSVWTTADGGKTYSAIVSVPQIDSYFNQHGAVLVYATFGNNTYEQLSEVYNGIAYSFSHNVGQVEIDIQSSNGTSVITPPGSLGIKVVLVESN
jgi:multimeric flavodoxin WrbA